MIRHFIIENQFEYLKKKYNLIYFFSKNKKRISTDIKKLNIKDKLVSVEIDLKRKKYNTLLGYVGKINNARRKKNLKFKKAAINQIRIRLNSKRLFFSYLIFSLKMIYPIYSWIYRKVKIGFNNSLNAQIKKHKLSLIIHPTVLDGDLVSDLIELGNRNNIPTLLLMNSWDNCTSRAFTSGRPSKYLVWGDLTKKYASENLNLPLKSIDKIGCAQFEIYKNKAIISKKNYRKKLGIKENEFLICYAGSNIGIDETKHLEIVDKEISQNNSKIKILYRPHPWKKIHNNEISFFKKKFRNVKMDYYSINRYKNLFSKKPKKIPISTVDYKQTNIVIKSIDAALVPMSTFAIECAINKVPISLYVPKDKKEFSSDVIIESDYFQFLINALKPILCLGEKNLFNCIKKLKKFSFKDKDLNRINKLVLKSNISYKVRLFNYIEEFFFKLNKYER